MATDRRPPNAEASVDFPDDSPSIGRAGMGSSLLGRTARGVGDRPLQLQRPRRRRRRPRTVEQLPARAELVLSRSSYAIGEPVVGTVRLLPPRTVDVFDDDEDDGDHGAETDGDGDEDGKIGCHHPPPTNATHSSSHPVEHPRSAFASAKLYLAGRCRVDPRWHPTDKVAALYGTHPLLSSVEPTVERDAVDACLGRGASSGGGGGETGGGGGVKVEGGCTVVFWATNVVNLLELPERDGDVHRWDGGAPEPLMLGEEEEEEGEGLLSVPAAAAMASAAEGDLAYGGAEDSSSSSSDPETDSRDADADALHLEDHQLAFTFRSDLPSDVPPSTNAACARYFYSAVVHAVTADGRKSLVVQCPFAVQAVHHHRHEGKYVARQLTPGGGGASSSNPSVTRVRFGSLSAVAHSAGIPVRVSPTIRHGRPTQFEVERDRAGGLCSTTTSSDVRTVRVTDQRGIPCSVLSLVGTSVLRPGGRVLLRFDFDRGVLLAGGGSSVLPCRQVCAALVSDEYAIVITDGGRSRRTRTRTRVLDAAVSSVEPGYTESASLSLVVPLDCPCTLRTDLVEVSVACRVELTVERRLVGSVAGGNDDGEGGGSSGIDGGYDALRLELPCEVVHRSDSPDDHDDEEDLGGAEEVGWGSTSPTAVSCGGSEGLKGAAEIANDLTMLSLHMIDRLEEMASS